MHNHLADFRSGQLALGGFVYHAFDFVHDRFELRCRYRPLFASLQQSLQNFLAFKAFAPSILLDHHVRNFVNPLVSGESALAFQAFAPTPNAVAGASFTRIDYLVIQIPAERTFHSGFSPLPPRSTLGPALPCAAMSSSSCFSCFANSRNLSRETPSRISSGIPATLHPANVTSHSTIAAATAIELSTPNTFVYAKIASACEPPPTAGNCTAEPTSVNASTSMQSPKFNSASPPSQAILASALRVEPFHGHANKLEMQSRRRLRLPALSRRYARPSQSLLLRRRCAALR